ncbi:MAG: Hint domain-containing protein [Pseudomonadota bacterium]
MTRQSCNATSTAARDRSLDLTSGVMAGARVLTMQGYRPIEDLAAGDKIITRTGMCVLRSVTVTEYTCRPYRIAHNALGKDRANAVTFVVPGQRVLLRDWRAKYLFGHEMVIVPVDRLKDDEYITQVPTPRACQVFNLHFEQEQIFYIDGVEIVSPQFEPQAHVRNEPFAA